MDFLDPRVRHTNRVRLMVGYVLIAIAIALGTVILVYDAYGYGINAKTGAIIQNGLLFVDSKPGNADIYLDGKDQDATTSSRLILPAKDYQLVLKKDGYRDWGRKLTLNEHTIDRIVYPLLFPVKPKPENIKSYPSPPPLITQTPDYNRLLVQVPQAAPGAFTFEDYDTNNPKQTPRTVTLAASLLTAADQAVGKLVEIEWSSDNRHLLLRHDYNGGSEFLLLDRTDPSKSLNLNRLFGTVPSQVTLRNKKRDQVYIFNQSAATVQVGDVTNGQLAQPFLTGVLAFKGYGANLVTYVTAEGMPAGQVAVRIWDTGQTYLLGSLSAGSTYLIDAAQFQGHWYYVMGTNSSERISIYKDPLDGLKDSPANKAVPAVAIKIADGQKVSFSANTRFIGIQSAQKFAVYDLEDKQGYNYDLAAPLTGLAHWMDGHRWAGLSNNTVMVVDYDGINQQLLIPSTVAGGGFFDSDRESLFSVLPADDSGTVQLQVTDMRAGSDLPQ